MPSQATINEIDLHSLRRFVLPDVFSVKITIHLTDTKLTEDGQPKIMEDGSDKLLES